jgi:hypothetical protein
MMGEEAWKDLMFDVEQMLAATNDLSSVQDEKMLHFRRGEISMMRWMLSLKETSENAYKGLQDETTD